MAPIQQTYIYTSQGRQRAVILANIGINRFVLTLQPGDVGHIETTCDAVRDIERGAAQWERFEGGLGGAMTDITALRAILKRNSGWAHLVVQQEQPAPTPPPAEEVQPQPQPEPQQEI